MYNDKLKVANKIITDTDLIDIFNKMWEELEKYNKICKQEEQRNMVYERPYQTWTAENFSGTLKFTVNFDDNTNITFDNYNNFLSIFNTRIYDIKSIYVYYSYHYSVRYPNTTGKYYSQSISMSIYEESMDVEVSLSSEDKKMDEVYNLIKQKILTAREKYDRVIKKKNIITTKICFGIGLIPSLILTSLLLIVPTVREVFSNGYVLYPICVIIFGYIIGSIFTSKVSSLYSTIITDKKYSHYDTDRGKSVYKDDMDAFMSKGEILIGKKTDNLKKREQIEEMEKKYSKFIPYELGVLLILSIIVIFL